MRTFAPKQKPTLEAKPVSSARLGRAFSGQGREVSLIPDLQRSIENHTAERLPQAQVQELYGESRTRALLRFDHDFSRIPIHAGARTIIQEKLQVNTLGDTHEQQADRIAEQVMHMPEPQLQRTCARGGRCFKGQNEQADHEHLPIEPVQAKDSGEMVTPPIVYEVLHSPGQPLDSSTREFMEPRFGHDFSQVRIHTDARASESARALNASAYTMKNNVVFDSGFYAPSSTKGRHLLAHELSHVLQQRSSQVVQRKIAVKNASVDLSSYLNQLGTSGHARAGNVYSHSGASGKTLESEILHSMLFSGRTFEVDGGTSAAAQGNLDDHVEARKGIVDFAAKKKYTFAAGAAMKMNPLFWEKKGDVWKVKPGVKDADAINDLNVNPKEYAIACLAATSFTMAAGSGFSPQVRDTGVSESDWIPGDWGYIKNPKFTGNSKDVGLEGENLIYVGYQRFWGHFSGTNTYRTLEEWFDEVKSWNGQARILSHRDRPSKGLL